MVKEFKTDEDIWSKYSFKEAFKDLFFYAREQKYELIIFFFMTVVISLLTLVPPFFYGKIVDGLTSHQFTYLFFYVFLIVLAIIFHQILHNYVLFKIKLLGSHIKKNATLSAFKKLLDLEFSFFESNDVGKLFFRIREGANAARNFLINIYRTTIIKLFSMGFILITLFFVDWIIGLFALGVGIFYFWYQIKHSKLMVNLEHRTHLIGENSFGAVLDFIKNLPLIKLLNIKEKILKLLYTREEDIISSHKITRKQERIGVMKSKLITQLSSVFVLGYMVFKVTRGTMSLGTGVMIYGFYNKFYGDMGAIYNTIKDAISQRTGMYRLRTIFEIKHVMKEPVHGSLIKNWNVLSINNVYFSYGSKNVLNDVSLKINKNERVGIVGYSGCGKSTLIKLLIKAYSPKKGSILFDEVNLNSISSKHLYSKMKVVPQNSELMQLSIKSNLSIASTKRVTNKQIVDSLKLASIYDFVKKLPQGINTIIGSDGVQISGGEKQRLSIARALITKPEIVILDESTSALDAVNETKIYENLKNLDLTLIAVTHRVSSLKHFDKIVVMDKGKILAVGTHLQLIRSCNLYKKLLLTSKTN